MGKDAERGNIEMKAIVLCAGFGTRLKPITDNTAKPLVKVMGIPIVEYTLNLLEQEGINEVFINRHHFPEQFENIRIPKNMKIGFSVEKKILGTLGGILSFEEYLKDDDFVVINGDILFSMDLSDLITRHKRKKSLATMVVKENDGKDTPVFVDDFSNIVSIGGDSGGIYKRYMFAGVHVLSPEFFNVVKKKDPPSCVVKDFYMPHLASAGHINAYVMNRDDLWIETGNLKQYLDGNIKMLELLSGFKLKINYEEFISQYWKDNTGMDSITELVEGIWAGTDNYIDADATISAPVFMGKNVKVEKGAFVGPNVIISDNVTISQNTHLKDSFILDGVETEKNTHIYRSIIGKDFKFEDTL